MKPKIKNLTRKFQLPKANNSVLTKQDVQPARDYIAKYWGTLQRFNPKGSGSLVGLPEPYLVPAYEESHSFDFNELYYWDSYFMVQGLLDEKHKSLVMGILDDLIYLFESYQVIPNASRTSTFTIPIN